MVSKNLISEHYIFNSKKYLCQISRFCSQGYNITLFSLTWRMRDVPFLYLHSKEKDIYRVQETKIQQPENCSFSFNSILKVRQVRNDFFKPMFLPKNERTNSTLLLVDLFSFAKTPKRQIEIN